MFYKPIVASQLEKQINNDETAIKHTALKSLV
jgi:hypothetical protein